MNDASYWDEISSRYDDLYTSEWSRMEDNDVSARLRSLWVTAQSANVNAMHVDLGAGTGLAQRLVGSERYIGIDFSAGMLSLAGDGNRIRADFNAGLPLRSESSDLVTALYAVASYAADLTQLLHEVHRILRPHGLLYLSALSRSSVRRLLRLKLRRTENFGTRHSNYNSVLPIVTCYSVAELRYALAHAGFEPYETVGLGALAGVAEIPAMYKISRCIGAWIPGSSHLLETTARRR